jgi:hypothetical protein
MDNDTTSMYDTRDFNQPVKIPTKEIVVKKNQFTSEVKIGDHTITVINPEYVDYINQKLTEMTAKCAMLENELRNIKQESRRKDDYFNRAITKINAKFGFNG